MKRIASFVLLLALLSTVVVGSFYLYVYLQRDTGAVSTAFWAGFSSMSPHKIEYAVPESEPACLRAYMYVRQSTNVHFIADEADSHYVCAEDTVYTTQAAVLKNAIEAVHEFGHALDRKLNGETVGFYSRQPTFTQSYANDVAWMTKTFRPEELFRTPVYRNPAVSDILFCCFFDNREITGILDASYRTAGVTYWQHDRDYMADPENRQTETFANLFSILLSDDEPSKEFVRTYLPGCTAQILDALEKAPW